MLLAAFMLSCGGIVFYLSWFFCLFCSGFFLGGGGCFCFASILIYYSGAVEDHICITQSHNKKKKTLHFSDHICTLSDKTLQSSLSAAAFCHECQRRPGIQQYVCSNPKKCTIGGWHLVLSGSFFKYSLFLSLTSMSVLCHIKTDIKHVRDDPDQRHPDFSL